LNSWNEGGEERKMIKKRESWSSRRI